MAGRQGDPCHAPCCQLSQCGTLFWSPCHQHTRRCGGGHVTVCLMPSLLFTQLAGLELATACHRQYTDSMTQNDMTCSKAQTPARLNQSRHA